MLILFYTLGCKVNQYETGAMRALVESAGYCTGEFPAGDGDEPAAVVVNSCTVTGESDRKLRGVLRRARRMYPSAILILTGCMPQAFPETAAEFSDVDIVLGNAARRSLVRNLEQFLVFRHRIVDIPPHGKEFEPLQIERFERRVRAFVKIEDGCNRFCSYCIVPYARGRVRSKPLGDIRVELEVLAQRGYCETVLAGINLTAYGQEWGLSLCDAVEVACGVEGIRRVRLGSLEPDMMDSAAIERLRRLPKLCPQFHLSLQSGCGATLERMNRRYTPAEYSAVCAQLREAFPGCALTTDIMVGFPGETDEEFRDSLEFVREIEFARVHVFAYSPRPGTPAAKAAEQVSAKVKSARSRAMVAVCNESRDRYFDSWAGKTAEVLFESFENGVIEGHSPQYMPVRVESCVKGEIKRGDVRTVLIEGHSDGTAFGRFCDSNGAKNGE